MAHAFLFVDDSPLHHQMYRLIFARGPLAGNTLYHAANGREGYALLAQHPELTLVFLDLNMPGMDGVDVAAALRVRPWARDLRIVAVTGMGQKRDLARTRAAGFDAHLTKPARLEDVLRAASGDGERRSGGERRAAQR